MSIKNKFTYDREKERVKSEAFSRELTAPKPKKAPLDRLEEYLGNRASIARKSGFNSSAKDLDEQLADFRLLRAREQTTMKLADFVGGQVPKPIGPSSTDYDVFMGKRPDLAARLRDKTFTTHHGYEVWRNAWLVCEKEHGIRKEAKS